MRTWKLATLRLACGAAPDCWIQKGEPYLELTRPSGGWKALRCAKHAPEAVPAQIDGQDVQAPGFTSTKQLAASVKRQQVTSGS